MMIIAHSCWYLLVLFALKPPDVTLDDIFVQVLLILLFILVKEGTSLLIYLLKEHLNRMLFLPVNLFSNFLALFFVGCQPHFLVYLFSILNIAFIIEEHFIITIKVHDWRLDFDLVFYIYWYLIITAGTVSSDVIFGCSISMSTIFTFSRSWGIYTFFLTALVLILASEIIVTAISPNQLFWSLPSLIAPFWYVFITFRWRCRVSPSWIRIWGTSTFLSKKVTINTVC